MTGERTWYLYVLECGRGVLYAGITTDVEARFRAHAAGSGAAFTRINPPVKILAAAVFPDRGAATVAEASLKRLGRAEKLRWVRANPWPRR
ncbi:MAG: GIY-YIG nuclease family protein [Deltaproteobacteria bacterium]|nr:GIY-YIG nuclease family protein [Deltaproteobacteria bacterium]